MSVSWERGPDASRLYCKTGNDSVRPPPHLSFSTGMDFSSVEGRLLWMFSDVLTSARCTQIFRWMARRCGSSAMWLSPGPKVLRENPRSLASPPFKPRRFIADSCKRPFGSCKLSSAPKGRNASSSSSQTL